MAWAVVIVFLMTAANFKSTEKLGASFAYLVLIATLFSNWDALLYKISGGTAGGTVVKQTPSEAIQTNLGNTRHP